jgi:hypothetical protein
MANPPYLGQGSVSPGSSFQNTSQSGTASGSSTSNTQQQGTANTQQQQANVYQPWQSGLQQQAGQAASNYLTTGAPPPGVTGAPAQLVQAYMDQFNQQVAPQLAAQYGAGSPAIGSQLALGLEQLNASVYGTNLNAYQNEIGQAGTLGFTPVGQTGTSAQQQQATSDTQGSWQESMSNVQNMAAGALNYGISQHT